MSTSEREEKSRQICEKLLSLRSYRKARTIFLFRSIRSEADLSFFADQALKEGKTILYPYCVDRKTMLAVKPGTHWTADRFGIPVPVLEEAAVVTPEEIDLVLCPCSAFDTEGHRLGMGAGYYDRFLPACRHATKILIAFEAQRLPKVCVEQSDVSMDAVITEERMDYFHV